MTDLKVKELTPKQESLLPVYRDKWIDIGLDCTPINKVTARQSMSEIYTHSGFTLEKVIFCESPLAAILTAILYKDGVFEYDEDYRGDGHQRLNIKDLESIALKRFGKSKLRGFVHEELNGCVYGNHEASWIGFYDYLRENFPELEEETRPIVEIKKVTLEVNWFIPYDNMCFISNRPEWIKWNEDGDRVHHATEPAIRYRDGDVVYIWNDVGLPDEWFENPESLTPQIALTWENIEQRRCACEILGWDKILEELNARVIDDDGDPQIGTLLEVDIPDIGVERFLRVECGTGRKFALPVPANMQTALEAQAWSWGIDKKEFVKPEIRT